MRFLSIFLFYLLICLVLFIQTVRAEDTKLLNIRADVLGGLREHVRSVTDKFEAPSPFEYAKRYLGNLWNSGSRKLFGEKRSVRVATARYEYVSTRETATQNDVSGERFTVALDALRYTPSDWRKVDYRKGKQVLTQQFFQKRFAKKSKPSSRRLGKVVYSPKQKMKRLGQIDFSQATAHNRTNRMNWLKKKLAKFTKQKESERRTNHQNYTFLQLIMKDINQLDKQTSLLSVEYIPGTDKQHHWLLAYKVEKCFIKECGQSNGYLRKAIAIHFVDLDPFLNERLKDPAKACYKLFMLETSGQLTFEKAFIEAFKTAREEPSEEKIQKLQYLKPNHLFWYKMNIVER